MKKFRITFQTEHTDVIFAENLTEASQMAEHFRSMIKKVIGVDEIQDLCDICKGTTHNTVSHYADIMHNKEMTRK